MAIVKPVLLEWLVTFVKAHHPSTQKSRAFNSSTEPELSARDSHSTSASLPPFHLSAIVYHAVNFTLLVHENPSVASYVRATVAL